MITSLQCGVLRSHEQKFFGFKSSASKVIRLSTIAACLLCLFALPYTRSANAKLQSSEQHVSIRISWQSIREATRWTKSLFMLRQILKYSSCRMWRWNDVWAEGEGNSFRLDILSHFKIGKSYIWKSNIKFYGLKCLCFLPQRLVPASFLAFYTRGWKVFEELRTT